MRYIKAYLKALRVFTIVLGTSFFIVTALCKINVIADYLAYLALLGGLGGPLAVFLSRNKRHE